MRKIQYIIFSISLVCFAVSPVFSQKTWWDRVTIRKAFETKTAEDSKPATFSFTKPKDAKSSYLVNAGLGFDFFYFDRDSVTTNALTGFFVYNRNTLVDKLQRNQKLGLSLGTTIDLSNTPTAAIFGATTLQYMRNRIDTSHAIISTSYWSPMYKSNTFPHIGGYTLNPHIVDYYFTPQVGLEYHNTIDANQKAKKGYDVRAFYSLGVSIKIKKKTVFSTEESRHNLTETLLQDTSWANGNAQALRNHVRTQLPDGTTTPMDKNFWLTLLELKLEYGGRHAFVHKNPNFERTIPLFTAGLNIYPFPTDNFALSVAYNKGANPIDGTPKQEFWLFSVTFKK